MRHALHTGHLLASLLFSTLLVLSSCQPLNTKGQSEVKNAVDSTALAAGVNGSACADVLAGDQDQRIDLLQRGLIVTLHTDGESGQRLHITRREDCSLLRSVPLPELSREGFSFQLADINYNQQSQLIGLYAADQAYIYHLQDERVYGPYRPQFKNERMLMDAQSGQIRRMELWEHVMIGHAMDQGCFVFDLSEPAEADPILPWAEYQNGEQFTSLFMIPNGQRYQAILPTYNPGQGRFSLQPVFDRPRRLRLGEADSKDNDRYLVLNTEENEGRRFLAIDLQQGQQVDLPADLSAPNEQAVRHYLLQRQ